MKLSLKTTFYWSLGGHAIFFILLLISSLITSCSRNRAPKQVHVFRLQAGPPASKIVATPPAKPQVTSQKKIVKSQPKQEPKKVVKKVTELKPKKRAEPKKESKPVSYDEFLKHNDLRHTNPQPVLQPPAQTPPPDPNRDLRKQLEQMIQGFGGADSTSDELQKFNLYVGQLRSQLNRLWLQPDNLQPGKWSAVIEFTVSSNGKVSKVHFKQKSGNRDFDQSLIRAMNSFVSTTPPPGGKPQVFTIPFTMTVR